MQAGLAARMLNYGVELRGLRQGGPWAAGDQLDGFGLLADAFAPQARALRYQRKAGGLGVEAAHHDRASHRVPFFEVCPAQGRGIFQVIKKGRPDRARAFAPPFGHSAGCL